MAIFKEVYNMLDEMIVHGNSTGNGWVIAYKANIWVFPTEKNGEDDSKSLQIVKSSILPQLGYSEETYGVNHDPDNEEPIESWMDVEQDINRMESTHDFANFLRDRGRSDVLVGQLYNKKLHIYSTGDFEQDPKSSLLIKKVAKTLKVSSVSYSAIDDEIKVGKSKIQGEIPDIAFHGTSSKYIMKILGIGLRPSQSPTNYNDIEHVDTIFFSTRIDEAFGHAQHTAHKTKSLPIIIEFIIPDKNLIVPDYDVDTKAGNSHYDNVSYELRSKARKNSHLGSTNSMAMSKEHGIYGYKGSIMPKFIKSIYFSGTNDIYSIKDMKKVNVKQFKRMVDMGYLDIY